MIHPSYIFTVGIRNSNGISLLGTGFWISSNKIATARHVIKGLPGNIVVIPSDLKSIDEFQDTTKNKVGYISCKVLEEDPIKDLCILEMDYSYPGEMLNLTSFNNVTIGEEVSVIGYPHCVEGRRVLTFQKSYIGAKVLLPSNGIKCKHAIINIQSRPGQSGSPIISKRDNSVVGLLIGAYIPNTPMAAVANINPAELHQTTHCISAEYIKDML